MKKFINISLIAGILCLFFGTGLFFVGGAMGGGKVVKKLDFSSMLTTDSKNLEKEYAVLEKTKIDDFDKINVKLNTIDFKIVKSDDKNCYIAYNLKKEKGEVTAEYEVSDGEFKLRQKSNHVTVNMDLSGIEALISGTKDYTQRNQFILYLPEAKQISSAELDMADGDISVDGLRSDRIDISVDAGDIKLLDTESKEIKIASSDGDMAVKDSKLNTVTINDSYGDIKFEDTDIDSGKISTNDGDISVKNTNLKGINITDNYGDIKCNDGSFEDIAVKLNDGDLRLEDTKFDGNIKIKSGYGDVKVIGFDDWKGISVNAKTSYGDVSVKNITDGDKTETSFERNIESPTATLEIKCSDGDISIR